MRSPLRSIAVTSSIPLGILLVSLLASVCGCHGGNGRSLDDQPRTHDEIEDANADGGEIPDGGGPLPEGGSHSEWVRSGWLANDCLWQTASKNLGLGKLRWRGCEGTVEDCRYLDVSDIEGGQVYTNDKIFWFSPSRLEDGTLRLTIAANYPDYRIHGVFDNDGDQLIAWKATKTCGVNTPQSHPDGRISIDVTLPDNDGNVAASRVAFGDVESMLTPSPPFVDVTAEDIWGRKVIGNITMVYRTFLGRDIAAFYVARPPRVVAWDYRNRPARIEISELVLEASNPIIVGNEIIFEQYGSPDVRGFAVRRPDGRVEMLYVKPGVWPAELMADDTNLAWQESVDLGDAAFSAELWTASISTQSPWQARKVAELGSRELYQGAFGDGHFAYRIDSDQLGLVRLADGAKFTMSSPPGLGWSYISGISAGEVWALLHVNPGGANLRYTIARIPIASIIK